MRGIRLCILAALATAAVCQEFEVASIKPNNSASGSSSTHTDRGRLTATNVSLRSLITMAYGLKDYQLEGPDWLGTTRFDITAKFAEEAPKKTAEYNPFFEAMMQKLLAERFKLEVHRSEKTFLVYGLLVGKKNIKFKEVPDTDSHNSHSGNTHYEGKCVTMERFASFLASRMDAPVLDMTGLKGFYDLTLDWVPESRPGEGKGETSDTQGLPIPMALEEQLGLRLEARKAPIPILIVDHAEKIPTEN